MPLLTREGMGVRPGPDEPTTAAVNRFEEVWEGVSVVPPAPSTEHFRVVSRLNSALSSVVDWDRGDQCVPGGNLSDRSAGWTDNYRVPDLLVFLAGNPAVDHGTHWQGGPDFMVEVISPGEEPAAKFDFYEKVNTREVLLVHRDPWAVELYQLRGGRLTAAGRSDLADQAVLTSAVLPVTCRLVPGKDRPAVEVTHPPTGQVWRA